MIFCCFLNCSWQIIYSMKLCHFSKVMSLSSQSTLFYLPDGAGTGTQQTTPNSKFLQSQPTFISSVTSVSFSTFSTIQHLLKQFPILIVALKYLVWFLFTHQDPDWHNTHIVYFQLIGIKLIGMKLFMAIPSLLSLQYEFCPLFITKACMWFFVYFLRDFCLSLVGFLSNK